MTESETALEHKFRHFKDEEYVEYHDWIVNTVILGSFSVLFLSVAVWVFLSGFTPSSWTSDPVTTSRAIFLASMSYVAYHGAAYCWESADLVRLRTRMDALVSAAIMITLAVIILSAMEKATKEDETDD